jgi:hypothetical protein
MCGRLKCVQDLDECARSRELVKAKQVYHGESHGNWRNTNANAADDSPLGDSSEL